MVAQARAARNERGRIHVSHATLESTMSRPPLRLPTAALLMIVLTVIACGPPAAPTPIPGIPGQTGSAGPSDAAGASDGEPAARGGIPLCDDVPTISAPAEAYRDTPIYVGNEMPVEALRAWAVKQPGYSDIWIDRDHNGWVTLAFSQDAAARQADLEREFPGVGAVAVEVEWTSAELDALQGRVFEALPPGVADTAGSMVNKGVVTIGVGVLTPERVALVEAAFAGQPVCIDGQDPADVPAPGPQQPAGDGWRLLATEPTGQPYRTGIAWDAASLADLWAEAGVDADIPAVDFQTDVVIWFGAVYGSSCPDLRLDDVVVDGDRRMVHAEIVLVDPPGACTGDAAPRAYLVAVPRSRLPAPTFAIQLGAEDPPGGAPEERTLVEADLRVPGSVAEAGQVHADPTLMRPDAEYATSGDTIEIEISNMYLMSVHCGVEWLGTLNDVTWRTTVPGGAVDWVPPSWQQVVAPDESLLLEVTMSAGPDPTVTATANGFELIYRPATESAPGCD
jgi:hypothetical protein